MTTERERTTATLEDAQATVAELTAQRRVLQSDLESVSARIGALSAAGDVAGVESSMARLAALKAMLIDNRQRLDAAQDMVDRIAGSLRATHARAWAIQKHIAELERVLGPQGEPAKLEKQGRNLLDHAERKRQETQGILARERETLERLWGDAALERPKVGEHV